MLVRRWTTAALLWLLLAPGCSSEPASDPDFDRDWTEDFESDTAEDAAEEAEQAELDTLDDGDDVEVGDLVPDSLPTLERIGGSRERFWEPELTLVHLVAGLTITRGVCSFPEFESFYSNLRIVFIRSLLRSWAVLGVPNFFRCFIKTN